MNVIKVLIVDDSAFMRKLIGEFLSEDERIEVIATARNGQDAIKKVHELKPDVVTMDIEMPVLDGLEALQILMKDCPVPVVMLSSTTEAGAESTLTAMQYGAFDFVAKPSGSISLDLYKIKHEIISKIVAAFDANVHKLKKKPEKKKKIAKLYPEYSKIGVDKKYNFEYDNKKQANRSRKIVLIGTSTGGPRALQSVLTKLPASFSAPILIVQHMPPGFTQSLAQRLDGLCEIRVKEAEDGELIQKGTAYIAPGGFHLKVKKLGLSYMVLLDQSDSRNGHRPSVDVMFESVSEAEELEKIAVVMTGMGMDGANGLLKLKKDSRVHAIAESEQTSIVFGMPKAAIATGLIDCVQDVDDIAAAIRLYC
ncbi:protein-glutamate methylesterase/protein-glutamine glutaminase [Bacillus massiliglaciei]|uniref:protein-glutamate methylesterase/protein-glutamine glutaminase n=1 Tax=Bacillus massiliglaciei TaxID=1816693 RepID=UPI000A848D35|nr:chemotaxis response regulator protein-glutamate methylesterase [Bacillus massiliglaciei]